VRLSASSRGLRMGVGPRMARIHVGSGRPSVSTGVGPVTVWQGVGSRKRRSGGIRRGTSRASLAAYEREVRQAQKLEQIAGLVALERDLVSVHREEFAPAERGEVDPPPPVEEDAIRRWERQEARRGVSMVKGRAE
jgi:hypothetical protein